MRIGIKIAPREGRPDGVLTDQDVIEVTDPATGKALDGLTQIHIHVEAGQIVTANLEVYPGAIDAQAEVGLIRERSHHELTESEIGALIEGDKDQLAASDFVTRLLGQGIVLARREAPFPR